MTFRISRYYPRQGKGISPSPTISEIADLKTGKRHELDFEDAFRMIHIFATKRTTQYVKGGMWQHDTIIGVAGFATQSSKDFLKHMAILGEDDQT